MPEYRHGALYVVEEAQSRDTILRALKEVDDRLFLERQVAFDSVPVWCVVCQVGGDTPPLTILEWRDENDQPLDLSSGIVERVKRMERDPHRLNASVVRKNAARIEEARRKARSEWEAIAEDFERKMKGTHSAVLHRGQHLRRSRDKRRSQGEIV